jgi:hypothetical protein
MGHIEESGEGTGSRSCRKGSQKALWIGHQVYQATTFYIKVIFASFVVILGGASLYNLVVGDQVPPVNYYAAFQTYRYARVTTNKNLLVNYDHEQCWDAIQPALLLLDEACPEASAWARDRHATGLLRWIDNDYIYASYHPASGHLSISRLFFGLNDGERAVTIAHEFRHSRQNFSKMITASVAMVLTVNNDLLDDIMEPDAYWFEQNVRIAIFGSNI